MAACTKVLFVDDERRILEIYAASLTEAGCAVGTAASAAEALALLAGESFDVAFVDYHLGAADGLELIREMAVVAPGVYPVIITAEGSTDLAVRAMKSGAADFIVKPFTLADLMRSMEHVERRRAVDRERRDILRTLEVRVQEKTAALERAYVSVLAALAQAMEKKDLGTYGHTRRVGHVSRLIAASLDLTREETDVLKVAALLHDIGKIGIADFVLGKKGRLDEVETQTVRRHPQKGVEILEPLAKYFRQLQAVLPAILHHHERFDGGGYPGGLAGERIPLPARIISVADTYDAIRSERPYRGKATHETAMAELQRCAGTQFDPEIVASFSSADAQYRRRFHQRET